MKKVLGWLVIALITMYFFPHLWYFFLAMAMLLVVVVFALALLAFMAKGLGIAGLEVWIARRILRKKKS